MKKIKEIVREMRERAAEIRSNGLNDEFSAKVATLFEMDAERIEAAAKELMVEKIEWCSECARMSNPKRVREILNENARLRAALKPVLDYQYPPKGVFSVECEYAETILEMMTAVREAKRIFNEGDVK